MRSSSLSTRLLLAVSLLLIVFFGATILVLEGAFRSSAEEAIAARLDVQLTVLLAAAEPSADGGIGFDDEIAEPRFQTAGSGLYGQVTRGASTLLWRAPSMVGLTLDTGAAPAPGLKRFERLFTDTGEEVFALSMGIVWELPEEQIAEYTFTAAESLAPFYAQVGRFRRQLLTWFSGLMALLLAAQAVLLGWVLRPLRQIETEIVDIEAGRREELGAGYPRELTGVARNTNRLIRNERARLARYRNTLGNLAHSLKTPLAIMRNALDKHSGNLQPDANSRQLEEQVARIDDIVGYQLQRAAASGGVSLGNAPVDVADTAGKVVAALDKVYADKGVRCTTDIDPRALFYGDQGDLFEILGNVIDNAYKWSGKRVRVEARSIDAPDARRSGLEIAVEDDGCGVAADAAQRVFARGVRADERVSGHGIGLAIVREIVELHDGGIDLSRSAGLGGARVVISLPPS